MLEIPLGKLATRNIRLRLFCNAVEESILGTKSNKFLTNQAAMAKALTDLMQHVEGKKFDARTWQKWFQGDVEKITVRISEVGKRADTKFPDLALGFLIFESCDTPLLAHLRAIDILSWAQEKEPGTSQAFHKRTAALQLLSKLQQKWKPNNFGVVSIQCDQLLKDDAERPYQIYSDQELFLQGRKRIDGVRDSKLPREISQLYQLGSAYCTLQYMERLLVEMNPHDFDFGSTWILDLATCVLLFTCLWTWDESELMFDSLAGNLREALDAGKTIFFHPPSTIKNARYLFGVGHPWGKFNALADPKIELNVLRARRIYNSQLLKHGISSGEVRDIVQTAERSAWEHTMNPRHSQKARR